MCPSVGLFAFQTLTYPDQPQTTRLVPQNHQDWLPDPPEDSGPGPGRILTERVHARVRVSQAQWIRLTIMLYKEPGFLSLL